MPQSVQDKRDDRAFVQETIYEMCHGCCRYGVSTCRVYKDPAHLYVHYGKCFAKMNRAQAEKIEQTLKFYTPDPLRWLAKINRLRKEACQCSR
jgi:hypothetical protein